MSSNSNRIVGVIPARLASTRLPRKVLLNMAGEPMLAWVYRAARTCPALDDVIVATDSAEVQQLCDQHGWRCILTSPDLRHRPPLRRLPYRRRRYLRQHPG
jgi:3-deoxy-manno-octulosonate cytidylyltransferase (CMP-KDO synthetase)